MHREETNFHSNLMHLQMHFQNKPKIHNGWGLRDQLRGAQSALKQSKVVYLMTSVPNFI
jgi:hypothetical protein